MYPMPFTTLPVTGANLIGLGLAVSVLLVTGLTLIRTAGIGRGGKRNRAS